MLKIYSRIGNKKKLQSRKISFLKNFKCIYFFFKINIKFIFAVINFFKRKKGKVTLLFIGHFIRQFVNNFSALLVCEIIFFYIFNMVNYFQILVYREVLQF